MFLVNIGISDNPNIIRDDIYKHLKQAKKDGIEIIHQESSIGDMLFIKCGVKEKLIPRLADKKLLEDFRYAVAEAITEAIIGSYESKLLKKIVKTNFFYLTERERSSVLDMAAKLLKDDKAMQPGGFYRATRRSKIMRSVLEYLSTENEINVEGFVNFRLGNYINYLNEVIERALEIFIAEREYNEFIKLLRYFVDIQECKIEEIHLCQAKDGRYILYDGNRNKINSEYFDELRSELADDSINYDDLLISTLITISPNRIVIHGVDGFKNKELVQTIMSVFAERISLCDKCELCGSLEGKETNNYSL